MYIHLPCLQLFYRVYPFKGSSANPENSQKRKPIKLQVIHLPYSFVFSRFQNVKFLLHRKFVTYFAPNLPHQVRGKNLKGFPEAIAVCKGDGHETHSITNPLQSLSFLITQRGGYLFR